MQEESGLCLSPGGKWQSLASQGDIAVNPVQTKMNETTKPWRDKEIPLFGQHSTNEEKLIVEDNTLSTSTPPAKH